MRRSLIACGLTVVASTALAQVPAAELAVHELEIYVQAGFSPAEALAAAEVNRVSTRAGRLEG